MARISGVINTLNEAHNIRYSLGSLLPWCDEVVVVDQFSDDGTADIAREMGARVLTHERTGIVEPARRFAVEQATGDWIIVLDADEVVPATLARHLRSLVDSEPQLDVVQVPVAHIILGSWARSARWWPGYRPRIFRLSAIRLSDQIHVAFRPHKTARTQRLPARRELALWHFSYRSATDLVEKVNRYTSFEAAKGLERGRSDPRARDLPVALARGLWDEVIRPRAWRDGMTGLVSGLIWAFYRFLEEAKRWDEPRIAARLADSDRTRRRLLADYGEPGGDAPG